jgi:hypothetical protein
MTTRRFVCLASLTAFVLAGCATIPQRTGRFDHAWPRQDARRVPERRRLCRNFANQQVQGLTANDAAVQSGAKSAIVGTAIGAAAGAAFGGGSGAAIGAGSGLLAGSAMGLGAAAGSAGDVQYRYDNAYTQCMATQGNERRRRRSRPRTRRPLRRSAAYGPPPPPPVYGYAYYPPPPPPGTATTATIGTELTADARAASVGVLDHALQARGRALIGIELEAFPPVLDRLGQPVFAREQIAEIAMRVDHLIVVA